MPLHEGDCKKCHTQKVNVTRGKYTKKTRKVIMMSHVQVLMAFYNKVNSN